MVNVIPFLMLNVSQIKENPVQFLVNALEKEAISTIAGKVTEIINFPPRLEAKKTRFDFPSPPMIAPELIKANFQVNISEKTIINRKTWKLSFVPFNKSAPSFNFWIDKDWNMRLAFQEIDWQGKITADVCFNSLENIKEKNPAQKLSRFTVKPKLIEKIKNELGDFYLPDGFQIVNARKRPIKDQESFEIRASNGLSTILIIISPVSNKVGPNLVVRKLDQNWIWVIANLSAKDLQHIAQSFEQINLEQLIEKF